MSDVHPDEDRADELTARYRAASAADPARPSDAARESIRAYARRVAVNHATRAMASAHGRTPAANDSRWRISAAASVIVAGFAAVLAWHVHAPAPVPGREPNPPPPHVAAHNPAATGSAVQPSDRFDFDRRTGTPAEAPSPAPDAAAELEREGSSVASSRSARPRIAGRTAAENATSGGSPRDTESALENPIGVAQVAPSATAAPSNVQSRALAASADTSAVPNSPLVTAAESGNLERVDQLLRGGISTEQTDARGRTALLVATLRGDAAMVRRLLAAGARADIADENGDTPLAVAQRRGPPELARLLERASHP
jgi:cytoskeletal protein RodZ